MTIQDEAAVRELEAQRDLMASRAVEYAGLLAEARERIKELQQQLALQSNLAGPDGRN